MRGGAGLFTNGLTPSVRRGKCTAAARKRPSLSGCNQLPWGCSGGQEPSKPPLANGGGRTPDWPSAAPCGCARSRPALAGEVPRLWPSRPLGRCRAPGLLASARRCSAEPRVPSNSRSAVRAPTGVLAVRGPHPSGAPAPDRFPDPARPGGQDPGAGPAGHAPTPPARTPTLAAPRGLGDPRGGQHGRRQRPPLRLSRLRRGRFARPALGAGQAVPASGPGVDRARISRPFDSASRRAGGLFAGRTPASETRHRLPVPRDHFPHRLRADGRA